MSPKVRVLVADDSAFARKVVREVLANDRRIEVVGVARDGIEALEKIDELRPDVVTLDLLMPDLDGVGVLEALRDRPSPPRCVIVTTTPAEGPLAIAALHAGAFDIVHKPTALATDRLYELKDELVQKVLTAARATRPVVRAARPVTAAPSRREIRTRVVVLGTSTGGPHALTTLLAALPGSFPVPIFAVVHMPRGFTRSLALRLDRDSPLHVREAEDVVVVSPGSVVLGRAGQHLRVVQREGACVAAVGGGPTETAHRPSADVLFSSAAESFGDAVLGVVLTGMGTDGLDGARKIRAAGGRVLVEDASTCVVHGMPRAVEEQGLANAVVPLDGMPEAILASL